MYGLVVVAVITEEALAAYKIDAIYLIQIF